MPRRRSHTPPRRRRLVAGSTDADGTDDAGGSDATEPVDRQWTCCICLDVFVEPVTTQCGHNFCELCFRRLLASTVSDASYTATTLRCPECRAGLPPRMPAVNKLLASLAAAEFGDRYAARQAVVAAVPPVALPDNALAHRAHPVAANAEQQPSLSAGLLYAAGMVVGVAVVGHRRAHAHPSHSLRLPPQVSVAVLVGALAAMAAALAAHMVVQPPRWHLPRHRTVPVGQWTANDTAAFVGEVLASPAAADHVAAANVAGWEVPKMDRLAWQAVLPPTSPRATRRVVAAAAAATRNLAWTPLSLSTAYPTVSLPALHFLAREPLVALLFLPSGALAAALRLVECRLSHKVAPVDDAGLLPYAPVGYPASLPRLTTPAGDASAAGLLAVWSCPEAVLLLVVDALTAPRVPPPPARWLRSLLGPVPSVLWWLLFGAVYLHRRATWLYRLWHAAMRDVAALRGGQPRQGYPHDASVFGWGRSSVLAYLCGLAFDAAAVLVATVVLSVLGLGGVAACVYFVAQSLLLVE